MSETISQISELQLAAAWRVKKVQIGDGARIYRVMCGKEVICTSPFCYLAQEICDKHNKCLPSSFQHPKLLSCRDEPEKEPEAK